MCLPSACSSPSWQVMRWITWMRSCTPGITSSSRIVCYLTSPSSFYTFQNRIRSLFRKVILSVHSPPEQPPTQRPQPIQHVIHVAEIHQLDQVAVAIAREEERVAAR